LLDVGDLGLHESGVLSRELLELDHDCGGRPLVSAEHVGEVRQVSAERAGGTGERANNRSFLFARAERAARQQSPSLAPQQPQPPSLCASGAGGKARATLGCDLRSRPNKTSPLRSRALATVRTYSRRIGNLLCSVLW
jgi:hypothetical protein